jgi:HAD superfamily hydrolase (TIGR01490 family)
VKLAVFDIDGTIFRSSLLIELFNELVRVGVFHPQAQRQVERSFRRWLDRTGSYDEYLIRLVRVFYRYHKSVARAAVLPAAQRVIHWQKNHVYRYTRDLVTRLRKQGYFLLAISGSPDYIVDIFAKEWGFDAAYGRSLEVRDGIYTGRIMFFGQPAPVIAHLGKLDIVRRFVATAGLDVDLRHCIAVGDSEGDLDILEGVGKPIAFNPSRNLARIAMRKKWTVIVERKNVVYHVHRADILPTGD